MMKEIYGYYVTEDGRLFNKKGKQMKLFNNGNGYYQARLWDGQKYITKYIHRLVWEAFVGPIPEGMQINHIDEDKSNNNLSNLEVCTAKYNINYGHHNEKVKASREQSGFLYGEASHQRKITYMREYNSRSETKERNKQNMKLKRDYLNEYARMYRQRRKEEGNPIKRRAV